MEPKEKTFTRIKLTLTIQRIIADNKNSKDSNKPSSLRQLAASSGVEYSIIQKISSGKKDPQFTTMVSILDGFGISEVEFFAFYNEVSGQEIKSFIDTSKRTKAQGNRKS
jgi:transcriptional regulator with XRE-family HTH domain